MPQILSRPKEKIKFLLLEGISDTAVNTLTSAGYTSVERLPKALEGEALREALKGHKHGGHPLAHAAQRGGARRHALADRHRLLLGRHQPGGPRRRPPHGHPGVQRAVLQHAQRGGADHRRDRHALPARFPEVGGRACRRLGKDGGGRLRNPRQDARHRRLRQYRQPARGAGRGDGHARHLLRPHRQAAPRQYRARGHAGRSCWRRATW